MLKGEIHTSEAIRTVPLKKATVAGVSIYVRKDWGPDMQVLAEWPATYRRIEEMLGGHVVLDIGANIGMFSVVALAKGAKKVYAYEPEPGAFSVLLHNVTKNCMLVQAAVTTRGGRTGLSVPASGNATAASTAFSARGRQLLEVDSVALAHAIEESRCTLLKTDCEGAELDWLDGRKLPASVRMVSAELHREKGNEDACDKVIRSFSKWNAVHAPKSYSFHRCWTINYVR